MGRGLSTQQREILAVARAFNAATRGGAPRMQEFVHHVRAGDELPQSSERKAVAELAWSPHVPDYHENFGLWMLCGFRSYGWKHGSTYFYDAWHPDTTNRSRRVSMARAVDGLLKRGMLCHAMQPEFVVRWFTADNVLEGYGRYCENRFDHDSVKSMAAEPLREFWKKEYNSWPAYWLTAAGHEAAGELWKKYDDVEQLKQAHAASFLVGRDGVGRHAWWEFATDEARQKADRELEAMGLSLRAAITGAPA